MMDYDFGSDGQYNIQGHGEPFGHLSSGQEQQNSSSNTYVAVRNSRAHAHKIREKENDHASQWDNRNDEEAMAADWNRAEAHGPYSTTCNQIFLNSNTDIFHELKQEGQ